MKILKKEILKTCGCFAIVFVLIIQLVSVVSATPLKITKFTKSPEKPRPNQTVLFRVRTEGDVDMVYISVDGEKDIKLTRKSNNIWELEKKFTVLGTRYIKVSAEGPGNSRDSLNDTIEVIEKNSSGDNKTNSSETTTEKIYTSNVEKNTETETEFETEETTREIVGGDDFDGKEYNEASNVDDRYFELSQNENMNAIDQIVESSVFMFVGENTFINKWKKVPLDDSDASVCSYIKNDYTLVPLRAVSEAFGANVSWDQSLKKVSISLAGKDISAVVGSDTVIAGNKSILIETPPEINNNRVFVPLRVVSEALGKKVYYNDGFIGITNNDYGLSENALLLIKDAVLRM